MTCSLVENFGRISLRLDENCTLHIFTPVLSFITHTLLEKYINSTLWNINKLYFEYAKNLMYAKFVTKKGSNPLKAITNLENAHKYLLN